MQLNYQRIISFSLTETTSSFIHTLINKLQKLITHSYITKIQDKIQSFHWNKTQATLHSTVVYYKVNNVLKFDSSFISDDLLHDVDVVHHVMKLTIEDIKSNISQEIETVHYFSDGCAGQYKN